MRSITALWAAVAVMVSARTRVWARDGEWIDKTREGNFRQFYVNYWKPFRRVREERWSLSVSGLVAHPRTFSLAELRALPARSQVSRLKCVECWSAKAEWRGFAFSELEKLVLPAAGAVGVVFRCADDYAEYLDLDSLRHPNTLLVYDMDGSPLSPEHGFPLRVIAPFKYGYKNPKVIVGMEFVAAAEPGTWSRIGPYSADGTILPGYDHPLELGGKVRRRIASFPF